MRLQAFWNMKRPIAQGALPTPDRSKVTVINRKETFRPD